MPKMAIGSYTKLGLQKQRLESRDTNRIKSKTVTFSCEISNSLLTSMIWEVFRPTTINDTHGTIASGTSTYMHCRWQALAHIP
jgi:hypothetical protein